MLNIRWFIAWLVIGKLTPSFADRQWFPLQLTGSPFALNGPSGDA